MMFVKVYKYSGTYILYNSMLEILEIKIGGY